MTSATTRGGAAFCIAGPRAANSFWTTRWYSAIPSSLVKSKDRPPKSVAIAPGSTIFTVTPISSISKLSASESPSTANFVPW